MPSEDPAAVQPRKRPLGVTLLSLAMGWLTFSAFLSAALFLGAFPSAFPGYLANLLAIMAAAYGMTAGATTIGLWRMKPWALTAFRAWGAVCLGQMVAFLILFRFDLVIERDPVPQSIMLVIFTGTVVLIYWLLHRYIKRRVAAGA